MISHTGRVGRLLLTAVLIFVFFAAFRPAAGQIAFVHLRTTDSTAAVVSLLIRPGTLKGASSPDCASLLLLEAVDAEGLPVWKGCPDDPLRPRLEWADDDGVLHRVDEQLDSADLFVRVPMVQKPLSLRVYRRAEAAGKRENAERLLGEFPLKP